MFTTKTKNMQLKQFEHTIHTRIENLLRHQVLVLSTLGLFGVAMAQFDTGTRYFLQQAYTQGFGWIGTYMHHEHPTHASSGMFLARIPTISGS